MTAEQLIAFERRVADAFEAKQIAAPVHLCSDEQAEPLVRIFRDFKPGDWLCSTWRSHFHCLLAGWPEEELFQAILDGRSMYLCSAKYRTICSAIVGGILPIAAGLAMGEHCRFFEYGGMVSCRTIWVCVGEMTARTGLFHEFRQYCEGHRLPVRVVVEDNGLSTNAKTEDVWGRASMPIPISSYRYARNWPHVATGQYVSF